MFSYTLKTGIAVRSIPVFLGRVFLILVVDRVQMRLWGTAFVGLLCVMVTIVVIVLTVSLQIVSTHIMLMGTYIAIIIVHIQSMVIAHTHQLLFQP